MCVCLRIAVYIYEIRDELCVCADDNHNKAIASLPGPFSPGLNYQSSMIFILCVRARCARCVFVVLQPIIHHMSNVVVVVVFFLQKSACSSYVTSVHIVPAHLLFLFSCLVFLFCKDKKAQTIAVKRLRCYVYVGLILELAAVCAI